MIIAGLLNDRPRCRALAQVLKHRGYDANARQMSRIAASEATGMSPYAVGMRGRGDDGTLVWVLSVRDCKLMWLHTLVAAFGSSNDDLAHEKFAEVYDGIIRGIEHADVDQIDTVYMLGGPHAVMKMVECAPSLRKRLADFWQRYSGSVPGRYQPPKE